MKSHQLKRMKRIDEHHTYRSKWKQSKRPLRRRAAPCRLGHHTTALARVSPGCMDSAGGKAQHLTSDHNGNATDGVHLPPVALPCHPCRVVAEVHQRGHHYLHPVATTTCTPCIPKLGATTMPVAFPLQQWVCSCEVSVHTGFGMRFAIIHPCKAQLITRPESGSATWFPNEACIPCAQPHRCMQAAAHIRALVHTFMHMPEA